MNSVLEELGFEHHIPLQNREIETKIHQKFHDDADSILGTYKRVNPSLDTPSYNKDVCCHELDRKIITRYRVGCHKLRIQTGRLAGESRDRRLCTCEAELQTLDHVLFRCPLTADIREVQGQQYNDLEHFFTETNNVTTAAILKAITKKLRL